MADFGGFEIEDDEKKPSSPSAFGGFEIEDGDEGAPGEKTPVASAEASTPKSPAPTVASPEPEAPPAPTWESGDGGEPTLPVGEKNQWGGNLRTEGRKPLIRRDAKGKVSGYSTTTSMGVTLPDGRIAVVPTVVDGKELSTKDAAKHYADTGEYWGMADNEEGAKKIARAVHDEHQKAYQEGWNEYIQSHWDDMGDEIRRDPGVRGEHARRKRDARLAEEMKAWGKDAEAIKGYRERTKTTQVAPELFLTGDLLEDADGNAIKPGDAIAVYHKEGDGPFTGEAGQAARLMEFTGVGGDGKPVFKEAEGVTSEGAMVAGKLHVRDEDFDRMMGKGEGKVERSPFEQVRLGALAETGDRRRYTDDAFGTAKAVYDRLVPYAGRMAPNEQRERTRHLSNIYEGKLDGYDGKTEAEKYRDAARKAGLEPWNPLESLHPDEDDAEFMGRIQYDAGEELRLDAIAKLDAGGKLSATEQSVLDKIVKGGIESGGYALEFALPGGAMFKGAQALNWGAKAVRAATMLGSAVPVVAAESMSSYQEYITPEYGFDDSGEFRMVAAPDNEEEAAYKAIGGAAFDTGVEVGLEAATMGLLRLAGKPAGWLLGKATPGAVKEWGAKKFNRFMASETGQALRSINRAYQDFSAMTQINSPLGELAEENVQAFEKVIGLDGKSSEYKGLAKEWQDFKDNQLNWKTQWDIFYGLVAQLAIGSAKSAEQGIAQHISSTDARRDIRMALKRSGISDETISTLTPEQQKKLDDMWRRYSANPDALKENVKDLGISMRLAADELLSRESSKMAAELKRSGIEPEKFVIQTGEDGKPAFQQMMRFGSDGSKVPMNAMTDAAHGVTIVDQGDGTFHVMNDWRGLDAIPAYSFEEAQKKADEEVLRNQRKEADNKIAAQRLIELTNPENGPYRGRKVVSIPSEAALRWQVAQAVHDGKEIFGITRADQLFNADGSLKQPGAGGFRTPDGHIVVILDNVPSPAEMERVLAHEATGHEGVESATGRGAKTVEFIQNAQAEGFSRFVEGERQRAIQRRVAEGMDEAAATAQVDAAMATDEYKRESMARYAQGRLHAPTWYERRKHEANERRRAAGENVPTDQADLEVMLAEQEAQGREGDNELETLPGDSGVRYEEGATDEAGNGADEAQPQPEQGEERGQEAPQPEAGAEPGAQAPDAGVVEPSKTDNGGQNLNTAPEERPVSADTIGGKPKPKPKGKRGDNLRGRSYEDYAKHPDEGGTADTMGAELMRFARDNGGLLKMPPKGVADPMVDWINAFLDGGGRKKNRGEFVALFGMKPKTGANDAITESMPTGLKDYVEKMIERDGPGAVADWFLETRRKYREWVQGRRDAAREERSAAKDRAEEAEALESFDFDKLAAARDAMDEEFANALGVVEGADEADYAALTPASLQIAKSGDTIRFDHDRKSFVFGSFDAGSGVLVVYDEDVAGMEGGKFRRSYRVTENSIEEIDDGQGNEVRADADRAGDEKGPAGGGGEAQGGAGRGAGGGAGRTETRKPEDLTLDSLTPAEQRAEQERISDQQKKAAAREDTENRRTAKLKGSGTVNVQPEMDLGQTGQQDLFSPIVKNEETPPAANEKAAERPAEYLAWLEKYKMKDTDRRFAEWQRKQAAQKTAKTATVIDAKKGEKKEKLVGAEELGRAEGLWLLEFGETGVGEGTEGEKATKAEMFNAIGNANDLALISEHRKWLKNHMAHTETFADAVSDELKKRGFVFDEEKRNWKRNSAPASAPRAEGTTTPPKGADAPQVVKTTRDGESIRIVENGREYEVELPDVKFPKTFTKATSKADWEAKMAEAKKIADELKKKAPFHSVINPKTGKYYTNDSEVARQRRREVAAYEEAVRRATNQAFDEIGEYDDSWDEEPANAVPQKTAATTPPEAAKPAEGGKSSSDSAPKSSAPTTARTTAKPAFKRGDRVFLKGAKDGQRVTFLKANADDTADVQVRTPGANRYAPEKVETRTVPMGDVSSTGMKDTLTDAERSAYRRGVAEQTREAMRNDPALRRIDAAYRAAKTDAERAELKAQFAERVRALQGGVNFDTPELSPVTPAEDAAYMDAVKRGDMETAQRMVREAAARAMPDTKVLGEDGLPKVMYHGGRGDIRVFDASRIGSNLDYGTMGAGFYFTSDRENAENYAENSRGVGKPVVISAFLNITNTKDVRWNKLDGENEKRSRAFTNSAISKGYDGFVANAPNGAQWVVAFNPNNIKSADAVTYDDAGNVIPLSQRFNQQNEDIRFDTPELSPVTPAEDAAYMDAVQRGDMETAERMVREAARAMPGILLDEEGNPKVVYHGTNKKFTVFDKGKQGYDPGFFFAENRTRPKNGWTKEYAEYYGGNVMGVFLSNPEVLPRGEYRVSEPSQIKSADPVTYDDAGNVIPLSQRFNPQNEDIRFDTPELTPAEAEYAASDDKTPTEKVMREVYGMTNDEIATAMKAAGMEPPAHVRKTDADMWRQVETLLSNPTYMAKLSRAVAKFPRPTRDYENVALNVLFRQRQAAVNDLERRRAELAAIPKDDMNKTPELRDELKQVSANLAQAEAQMAEAGKAAMTGASEQGRALRSNRALINAHDYSYAGIAGEIAENVGGAEKITPEMDARIRDLAKLFEGLDAEGLRLATERLIPLSKKVIDQTKNGLKVRKATERKVGDVARKVAQNYQDALTQIEVGAVETGGTLVGLSDQQYPSWGKWLRQIGEYHCFLNPEITEEEVIDAIVRDISPFMDGVDANQVRDALTGFGHNYKQSRYDAQRLMNSLRNISRSKRQIDWMDETNTMPPATGPIRDEPTQDEREWAKRVRDRKEEVPDAGRDERRLKSTLDTIKRNLENRIADLKRAIETGERIPAPKRKVVDDIRVRELRAEKDELQKQYDELFGTTREMTDAQRIALTEKLLAKELERAMEDFARAQAGDFSKRPQRPGVTSATIEAQRDRIRQVRESIRELKNAKYAFGMTPEEVEALNARKMASREKALARLAERIATGDIRPQKKPQPPMTKDQQKRYDELGEQMKRGRQKLAELRLEAENATVPTFVRKGVNFLRFVTTAQRALRATMDFSAVLRQAARMTLGHPVKAAQAFGKAWTAARSEASLLDVNTEILSDPTVQEAVKKFGLHLREVDAQSDRDVEMFHGMERNKVKIFGKEYAITDIPLFGEFMLKSERHYLTYLNAMSADLYTSIVNGIPGGATPWQKKMVADMINIWNGSAALSKERRQALQKAWVNDIFWAPQLAISRVQSAVGYDIWHPLVARGIKNADGSFDKVSNGERKTAAKIGLREHLRSTVAMLAIGALLKWLFLDDDDKYDFSQADWFEKMMMLVSPKVGNSTIDLTGGESTFNKLVHQLATRSKRTGTGRLQKFGDFNGPSTWGVIGRYLQGKLSPSASTIVALWEGKDYVGEEYGVGKMVREMLVPLTFEDVKDQIVQNGVGKSLVTVPLSILGAGGSTYDRKPYENAVNRFLEAKKEYDAIQSDDSVSGDERNQRLSVIRDANPLMRDEVREKISAHVKRLKGWESKAKKAKKAGKSSAEIDANIEKEKENILKMIREARK